MFAVSYPIPEENLDRLEKHVQRLNNKLAKGFLDTGSLAIEHGPELFEPIPNTDPAQYQRKVWVSFYGTEMQLEGWTFVARYDFEWAQDGSTVCFAHAVPGQDLPADRREGTHHCDHCNSNRRRNNTFLFRSEEGEFMQVGRTCLKDMFGHSPAKLAQAMQWLSDPDVIWDEFGAGGDYSIRYLSNVDVLLWSASITSKKGWVSSAKARQSEETGEYFTSTATHVAYALQHPPMDTTERQQWSDFRAEYAPNDDNRADAYCIAQLIRDAEDSDYVYKLNKILDAGWVSPRNMSTLVSAVVLLIKHKSLKKQEVEMADVPDIVEGRQELELTIVSQRREAGYGYYDPDVLKVLGQDAEGRKYWGTLPSALFECEDEWVGKSIHIRAGVTRSDKDSKFGFFKRPHVLGSSLTETKEAA